MMTSEAGSSTEDARLSSGNEGISSYHMIPAATRATGDVDQPWTTGPQGTTGQCSRRDRRTARRGASPACRTGDMESARVLHVAIAALLAVPAPARRS